MLEPFLIYSFNCGFKTTLDLCACCVCRCMFSIWLLVTRHCQNQLCGIFHHIDSENNYATPSLFLKVSGGLMIQIPATLCDQKVTKDLPHVCRSVTYPDERGIWWIRIYLSLPGSFKPVVPDQCNDTGCNGEWARVHTSSGILAGCK